jgi:poly-gamma-glutamate synthesis protein (capsule biosynthesis protein)
VLQTHLAELRQPQEQGLDDALAALQSGDLALGNLETPLSARGQRVPKLANLRVHPDMVWDIKALGFSAVTLANNHMMDYGPAALLDTLDALERVELPFCGAGQDLSAALAPVVLRKHGWSVGLLNVSCTLPEGSEATPERPGIAPLHIESSFEVDPGILLEQPGTMPVVHTWARTADLDHICDQVRALRAAVDTVIVGIHWGAPSHWLSPYQGQLAEYQQPVGHALVDAGADVVWGHHSHELDPIELYGGKPILYGLGHFILEKPWDFMTPESVIVRLTPGEPAGIDVIPLMIDERGLPRRAYGDEAALVLRQLVERSAPFGTRFELSSDHARVLMS